ncbi:MAG TPA: hypothetical protein VJO12_15945 [Stellaceae bacterium]|nr:hypothetical protein [Stellaceae bacterium]
MLVRSGFAALLMVGAVIMASACSRTRPVYNVQDHPIPAATQQLPLDQIGQTIIQAGRLRHWRMDPAGPGQITGVLDDHGREAVINVTYSQQAYSITLAGSTNLRQEGDEVHKKYNKWVRQLEREIDDRLSMVGYSPK